MTDLVQSDLTQPPAYDAIDQRRLALIKSQIAPRATDGEVAHFLELCHHYGLDPFAREAWCAKSEKGDRLLVMVGRDGLRKIAQRQGIHVDGDVVRAKDTLSIVRTPDGNRTVAHSYGNPAERGEIVGAWAECRKGGPTGVPLGYFYAPLEEYMPKNVSAYSPWSKQVGVMILAAAERQAIRQATPLGGLLAVGEDETINDRADLTAGESVRAATVEVPQEVEALIVRARELGHAGLANREAWAMRVGGDPQALETAIKAATGELNRMAAGEPAPEPDVTDAEVVDAASADTHGDADHEVIAEAQQAMRDRLAELEDRIARAAEDPELTSDDTADMEAEAEHLRAQLGALADPNQQDLGL